MRPYILICQKTGRHWGCCDFDHGDTMARRLGLKDYAITPTHLA